MATEGLWVRVKNHLVATAEAKLPKDPANHKLSPDFAQLVYNKGSVTLSSGDVTSGTGVDVSKTVFNDSAFAAGIAANGDATTTVADGSITIGRPGIYLVRYTMAVEAEDVDAVGILSKLMVAPIATGTYAEQKEARAYGVIDDATGGTAGNHAITLAGHTFVTCNRGDLIKLMLDFRAASAQKVGLLALSLSALQVTDSADV